MLHARVMAAIEHLYPDQSSEHVERLAHHAQAGEAWERAAQYFLQAAGKALGRSASHQAATAFRQALEMIARVAETPEMLSKAVEAHLGLRNALAMLGEHESTLGSLRQAQSLAARLGDQRRLGRALSFEVNCLCLLGRHREAIESAGRARAVAESLGDLPLRIATDMYTARAYAYLGDFPRAMSILRHVLGVLTGDLERDHLGLPVPPAVFARSQLVEILVEAGHFAEAAAHANEALRLAEQTDHPDTLFWAYHGLGVYHLARRDPAPAAEMLERAYALCERHDMPAYFPRVGAERALAWALGGRATEALAAVEQALDQAITRKQPGSYSKIVLVLAEVALLAGQSDRARAAATRGLDLFRRQHEQAHEASALWLLGAIAADKDPDEAAEHYRQGATLATVLGMLPLVARCEAGLAALDAPHDRRGPAGGGAHGRG
jgi:tetratricopeptide (TPR) repeat protein